MLAACGDDGASTGQISLGVTDSPVDYAEAVVVQFTGVELKPKEGPAFSVDFPTPKTIDLLALHGEERVMLLDGEVVEAGEYLWMRLKVLADPNVADDSYVSVDGQHCEMRIPSGDERGLQLIRAFTVGVGTTTDYTVDFDLRRSVLRPPGLTTDLEVCGGEGYHLKPVLRMVDNLEVGTITGTVTPQCGETTTGVYPGNVYLFGPVTDAEPGTPEDYDGIVDDLQGGPDPLASAMVDPDSFTYTIGYVPAGNYRLAYTCNPDDAAVDEANPDDGVDDLVLFTPADGMAVTVTADQTTTVDLPPP
jgi:hypothetical protein